MCLRWTASPSRLIRFRKSADKQSYLYILAKRSFYAKCNMYSCKYHSTIFCFNTKSSYHNLSFAFQDTKGMFGNAAAAVFSKNLNFFFLLKFNMVCMFWIVLMCWCQKWFLKNKKISLTCILARKVIWKAPATTLPNTF
jgi:hypothetical protein